MNDLWVFGYGSLIWHPGFEYEESVTARLAGYRRSLCVHSYVHRGTPERPGLVFGLDRGGSCIGRAFRVAEKNGDAVTAYLRERELVTNVYLEVRRAVRLADGRSVEALAYVVDRRHVQYAGTVSIEDAATVVAGAHGRSGPNVEYVRSGLEHIREMGIRDRWLEAVVARL